jgi:hypothetical protein
MSALNLTAFAENRNTAHVLRWENLQCCAIVHKLKMSNVSSHISAKFKRLPREHPEIPTLRLDVKRSWFLAPIRDGYGSFHRRSTSIWIVTMLLKIAALTFRANINSRPHRLWWNATTVSPVTRIGKHRVTTRINDTANIYSRFCHRNLVNGTDSWLSFSSISGQRQTSADEHHQQKQGQEIFHGVV